MITGFDEQEIKGDQSLRDPRAKKPDLMKKTLT